MKIKYSPVKTNTDVGFPALYHCRKNDSIFLMFTDRRGVSIQDVDSESNYVSTPPGTMVDVVSPSDKDGVIGLGWSEGLGNTNWQRISGNVALVEMLPSHFNH